MIIVVLQYFYSILLSYSNYLNHFLAKNDKLQLSANNSVVQVWNQNFPDDDVIQSLPNELLVEILNHLSLGDLKNTRLVARKFNDIILNNKWPNVIVRPKNIYYIMDVRQKFKFCNYDLSRMNIIDDILIFFVGCEKLYLNHCKNITDEGIKMLAKCHTIDLSFCDNVTDEGIKMLTECHTLNLTYCKITDKSVKLLANCHTLDLSFCYNITDESVKNLGKCHTLDLSRCSNITDESVKFLVGCNTLNLSGCKNITDESARLLHKCHTLNLNYCNQVTIECVETLQNHCKNVHFHRFLKKKDKKILDNCHTQ